MVGNLAAYPGARGNAFCAELISLYCRVIWYRQALPGDVVLLKLQPAPEVKEDDVAQRSEAWLTAVDAPSLPRPTVPAPGAGSSGAAFPLTLGVGFIRLCLS